MTKKTDFEEKLIKSVEEAVAHTKGEIELKTSKKKKIKKVKEVKAKVEEVKAEIKEKSEPKKKAPKRQRIPKDLANISFGVGDKVKIHDRSKADNGKSGKIVSIDKLESTVYNVLLDIVETHNDPKLVNKRQKVVGLFKNQMQKV